MANTVTDQRRKNFYMTENTVIDFYARKIGCTALSVYNVMERRCDGRSRQVKISNGYIAETLGVSLKSVTRAINVLEEYKMIHRESGKNDGQANHYILRNVHPPKTSDSAPLFEGGTSNLTYPPSDTSDSCQESDDYQEDTGGYVKNDVGGRSKTTYPGTSNLTYPVGQKQGGGRSKTTGGYVKNDESPLINARGQDSFQDSFQDLKPTTTTLDRSLICDALLTYVSAVDDEAVNALISGCMEAAPDVTADEIVYFIQEKAEAMNRMPRRMTGDFTTAPAIHNRLGFLLSTVPKCFEGSAFQGWRRKREAVMEKQRRQQPMETAAPEAVNLEELATREGWTRKEESPWNAMLAWMKPKLNVQSFDTWLKPTRYVGEIAETLFVEVPAVHWITIGERYNDLILEAVETLGFSYRKWEFVILAVENDQHRAAVGE